jgi:hypothetical protein
MKICSRTTFKKLKMKGYISSDCTYFEFAFIIPVKIGWAKIIYVLFGIDINK